MDLTGGFNAKSILDFESWKVTLRTLCGRYNPEGVEPNKFAGSVRPADIFGPNPIQCRETLLRDRVGLSFSRHRRGSRSGCVNGSSAPGGHASHE
jgi:hypothetical protein